MRASSIATLEDVRDELERVLGIYFEPSHDNGFDGKPAFECAQLACKLRLNCWAAENPELTVFNFVGVPSEDLDGTLPRAEDIKTELATHLRASECDWYVPSHEEALDEGGVLLNQEYLDRDAIVAMLAPRWLAWFEGDEREAGMQLLQGVADLWLSAARRAPDPITDVKRRKAEFQGWGRHTRPRSRLDVLFSYFVQAHLAVIEDELFDLQEMQTAELAAVPRLGMRLAEWRELVVGLAEAARDTRVDSIQEQQRETLTAIDELTKKYSDATKR